MFNPKIVVVALFLVGCSQVNGGLAPAPVVAPAVRYVQVAPQNIAPFAAQVSTFTKGLNVYDAPYAAGVLSAPAIVPKAFVPAAAPVVPAPFSPVPIAPAPIYPAAPVVPAVAPALYPAPVAAAPNPFFPISAPAPLLPAPFARSVHAVAPAYAPHVHRLAPAVPALHPALHSTTLLG